MLTTIRSEWKFHSGLPHGWQGPKWLSHHFLLPTMHISRKPDWRWDSWNLGVPSKGCATMSTSFRTLMQRDIPTDHSIKDKEMGLDTGNTFPQCFPATSHSITGYYIWWRRTEFTLDNDWMDSNLVFVTYCEHWASYLFVLIQAAYL